MCGKNSFYSLIVLFLSISSFSSVRAQTSSGKFTQNLSARWLFRKAQPSKPAAQPSDTAKVKHSAKSSKNAGFLTAHVPGNVHLDLLSNKLIADPFYRSNEKLSAWVEKTDWEYQTSFTLDKRLSKHQNIDLMLDGLDTYARIYLNDSLILRSNDMFTGWSVAVKKFLKPGENVLRIYFESAVNRAVRRLSTLPYALPSSSDPHQEQLSMYTRKASYQYGWESGPRLVTCGIWKPVYLQGWDGARIRDVQFRQKQLDDKKARMTAVLDVEGAEGSSFISLEMSSKRGGLKKQREIQVHAGLQEVHFDFDIDQPQKWWPNGMGTPVLYDFKCTLRSDQGQVLDSVSRMAGLRTIELVTTKDSSGNAFYFKVNGQPLYIKGANYVPQDNFPPRVNRSRYDHILSSAVDSHMNMLRVWGGGIYENDYFYDEADRRGLLVWQDFMFSSAMYPGDSAFVATVRREAEYTVKRLRNHPSLAIWCGNNDIENAWLSGVLQKGKHFSAQDSSRIYADYKNIFERVIPEQVRKLDPGRFYMPGSPSGKLNATKKNRSGDMHFFTDNTGLQAADEYKTHIGRFMSAFGLQSFPGIRTFQNIGLPADEHIDSGLINERQKKAGGNQIILGELAREYRSPKKFSDYLYESQLMQAEGLKAGIEAQRRSRGVCMGSMYWQFNECWPGVSASAIDFYGRLKPAYYFAKKAFTSIMLSPVKENGKIQVYIISDQLREMNAELKIQFMNVEGDQIMEKRFNVLVYPNQSHVYYSVDSRAILGGIDSSTVFMKVSLIKGDNLITDNILFFSPVKNIPLELPELSYQVQRAGKYFWLNIKSFRLAKNIYLDTRGDECEFSDNYFDLMPGESRSILVKPSRMIPDLGKVLKIETLNDLAD